MKHPLKRTKSWTGAARRISLVLPVVIAVAVTGFAWGDEPGSFAEKMLDVLRRDTQSMIQGLFPGGSYTDETDHGTFTRTVAVAPAHPPQTRSSITTVTPPATPPATPPVTSSGNGVGPGTTITTAPPSTPPVSTGTPAQGAPSVLSVTSSMPTPSASLTASPATVAPGQSSTLSWTTSNATTVTLNGTSVPDSGSLVELPQSTTTYTLTAANTAGSKSSTATVTVTAGAPTSPPGTVSTPNAIPPGDPRDPATWPFATNSVWNYPIGSNAKYNTGAIGNSNTWANIANGHFWIVCSSCFNQTYIATTSDPFQWIKISGDGAGGTQNTYGTVCFQRHFSTAMFPLKDTVDPIFSVVSPDHLSAIETYGASVATTSCGAGINQAYGNAAINVDLKGPGIWNRNASPPTNYGDFGDMALAFGSGEEATPANIIGVTAGNAITAMGQNTAARYSRFGGIIRKGEFRNGIHHALDIQALTSMLNQNSPSGNCVVFPAAGCDTGFASAYGTSGPLYMGGLIAIPNTVNLAAHTFDTVCGKNLAYAFQQYGAYVSDTAGGLTVVVDQDGLAEFCADNADMLWIGQNLAVVTNSYNPTTGGPPRIGYKLDGGDGTVNSSLIAPPFGAQWGGGNGRYSYFVPHWPRSLWAWITRGILP